MAPETVTKTDPPKPSNPLRRGRAHRAGRRVLTILVVFAIFVSVAVLIGAGGRLIAPDWVRDRIEARIERLLDGLQVEFGDVSVVISKGWLPRVLLRDVVLRNEFGQMVAQMGEAEAALALRPLLRGQVQPQEIVLNGALATIRRDRDGNVALMVGGAGAPVNQAEGLPQLIETWDRLFQIPQLAALSSVEIAAVTLRYEDAQQGRAWTLDGGTILLARADDRLTVSAAFSLLSGREYASTIEMSYASRIGESQAEFGLSVSDIAAEDIAAQSVALAWLDILRAPISGSLRGGVKADGSLAPLSATLQIGAGVLQPLDQARPIPFSGARSYFTYEPDQQLLTFNELSVSSDWGSGLAEGGAWLGRAEDGKLNDLTGQFNLRELSLNPGGVYPEPLSLEGATVDFRLGLNPFSLQIDQMLVADQGGNLRIDGTLDADTQGWHLALNGEVDQITTNRLIALWPEGASPKPRKWVRDNLLGGVARNATFSLRAEPGQKPVIDAGFAFKDATIRFLKTMPPLTDVAGQARLSAGRFVVDAEQGRLKADQGGELDITGTRFIIPDVTIRIAAPGVVQVKGKGPVTAVLSLLNRPPLRVLKDTRLPVDVADGRAQISGTLSLPLKKRVQIEEMTFDFQGSVSDVSSEELVPGFRLEAPLMQVIGDQTYVALSGKGQIGPVPVDVTWRRPIGKGVGKASRVTGQIELSQLVVDTFGIGLPKGMVSGQGIGQFTLDLAPGKPPELTLRSDLEGVGLRLAPLGWAKPKASNGLLEISGTLGEPTNIDRLVINAAGLSATGNVVNRVGGGLDRAQFSSVRIGRWLDARVELVGRGKAAPPLVRIHSGTLDMRRADFDAGSGGSRGQSGPLEVSLTRLQVTDTLALDGFTGQFRTNGGLSGPFQGRLNGQTKISGNMVPRGNRSAFIVESNDAGGVFRSAGLLTQARGGKFRLSLLPVAQTTGQYDGVLRVTNTRVKNAPAIAALLNAVSVVGLLDELAGQGIQFTEVDAKFRLGPSQLVLYESSAVGPSIGLSMDGLFDVPRGILNMRGVISPVYLLNGIGSFLTRKGEGVIGFNYTLTGAAAAPKVQVNPLSGLAPGMFRNLFRAAPPTNPNVVTKPPVKPNPNLIPSR